MLLLALSVAPGIAISLYIMLKDQYNREPKLKLLICFLLGMLSIVPAVIVQLLLTKPVERFMGAGIAYTAVFAYLIVGLSEELSKFWVLRYYAYPRKTFDEPLDGIVYSVLVGMGFATIENIGYVMENGLGTAIMRMFLSVPAHATFAVLMGYFAGKAKFQPHRSRTLLFRGVFWATFFHGTYDFFLFLQTHQWVRENAAEFLLFLGAVASLVVALVLSRKAIRMHVNTSQTLFMNQAIVIRNASVADIPLIQSLTMQVWPQTYSPILSDEQITYMLNMMYSTAALEQQLNSGHRFVIAEHQHQPVGFAAFSPSETPGTWKLHKLYVIVQQQKTGAGKALLQHVLDAVRRAGGNHVILQVNRQNENAIGFYKRMGFSIEQQADFHIGNNYYMNDYIMGIYL